MTASRGMTALLRRCSLPFAALLLAAWAGLAAASDPHPIKHGEGRMWRVERGTAPPSHIIGTMHVSDRRVRNLPQPIQEVFQRSEQAAFELRFTPEEREAVLAGTGQTRACRCDLAGQLDKKTYARVVARAAKYGLPAKVVGQLHPFMLIYIFSMPPEEYRRQLDGDLALDFYLIQWAYDLGMRVEGLETLEEHMGVFDLIPERDFAEVMREQLDRLDAEPGQYEQLLQDYLVGDMRRTYREFQEEAERDASARRFKEAFLDQRNRAMVERMIPLLERGRAFVAVGALHMPGEEGILSLLERRGYRVTRVH
ncbi:TraB/GumN family protein [Pelagibius sp. CAU 1746]|uniref:TraB/GumN family protein n=1 Tax=Pelagibius sp. CAU 1746 TaxID=3140370 RepID=UPI00325AE6EE